MKYLPKSKLGLSAAVIYLLLVFLLIIGGIFGGGGLHGTGAMTFVFAFILTLPLSEFAKSDEYISVEILAISAVINAGIIYLAVGFASRALGAVFRRLNK